MLICYIISIFYIEFRRVKLINILLSISIVSEILVELIGKQSQDFFIVYHFFIIFEFTLITVTLKREIENRLIQRLMTSSMYAFIPASLYISFYIQSFEQFPSISATIEALFIIIWCIVVLLSLDPKNSLFIYRNPIFWVTLSFFIYFAGTISINGIYNYLLAHKTSTAKKLYTICNSISNYLLYIILTIGIICHKWEKRSLVL